MKWLLVLIIYAVPTGSSPVIEKIEFESEYLCQAAQRKIVTEHPGLHTRSYCIQVRE